MNVGIHLGTQKAAPEVAAPAEQLPNYHQCCCKCSCGPRHAFPFPLEFNLQAMVDVAYMKNQEVRAEKCKRSGGYMSPSELPGRMELRRGLAGTLFTSATIPSECENTFNDIYAQLCMMSPNATPSNKGAGGEILNGSGGDYWMLKTVMHVDQRHPQVFVMMYSSPAGRDSAIKFLQQFLLV